MDWIKNISESQLKNMISSPIALEGNSTEIHTLGIALASEIFQGEYQRLPSDKQARDFWQAFGSEMYLLVCTEDENYRSIRDSLNRQSRKTTTVIVSFISAAVADRIGFTAGALVPLVALCLFTICKAGLNAFCKSINP